jgi:HD-GYP domain-containing protein (c-di-GMP phosphodiesterase class II)
MLDFIDSLEDLRDFGLDQNPDPAPSIMGRQVVRHTDLLSRCEQLCGLSLSVIDPVEGRFVSGMAMLLASPLAAELTRSLHKHPVQVQYMPRQGVWLYGLQVPGTDLLAGGVLLRRADQIPESIRDAADMAGLSEITLQAWAEQHAGVRPELAIRLLQSAHDLMRHEKLSVDAQSTTTSVVGQLGQAYEEVVLIQDLSQYLSPDIAPPTLAAAVLERVRQISDTELSACLLRHGTETWDQLHGEWELDGAEIESLIQEILGDNPPRIIVRNRINTSPRRLGYPKVRSLVAVPLFVEDSVPSWLVLANPPLGRELGTEEANLLKSIGGILSSHTRVVDLFRDHREMVLSFIRSLVSTLDAKDPYTRGHSERVALVAQRIAQELELPESEIEAIYQSGLLHDIGKIGLDDSVLQKPEELSALEFRKVVQHPEVGYAILRELKNLSHLLPGVLHHHERYDGRGYPHKLEGTAIPRMARILAVADAFDAMGSDRPYRKGRDRNEVELTLAKGSGTQWDPEVINAFFSARVDIYRIWGRAIEYQQHEALHSNPPACQAD